MNRTHRIPSGGSEVGRSRWGSAVAARIAIAALVLLPAGWLFGCGTVTRLSDVSSQPVQCRPVQVLAQSSLPQYGNATLGIFPAAVADKLNAEPGELTRFYYEELLRTNAFRAVKILPQKVRTGEDATWWGRSEGFDLVMKLTIRNVQDGTGNLPTRLEVSADILDVRSGTLAWSAVQNAYSEPGRDVDLTWTTLSGDPAQRARVLARALARQFMKFVVYQAVE